MFDNIKLEKGLYNLAGKSFVEALEEFDPSENYIGTPLEGLDAYERQLKRFDIKVKGSNCDCVEKFFSTTETAVLFPEYIKRCILQGVEDSKLGDIVAIKTITNATCYKGLYLSDTTSYTTPTNPTNIGPDSNIYENSSASDVQKFTRMINCPYEVIRQQKIDILSIYFRIVGRKMGMALYSKALALISSSGSSINISDTALSYNDLINLFSQFTTYNVNTVIASPKTCASILQLPEISEHCCCNNNQEIILPFGAKLIKSSMMDDAKILAIDKDFAIEYVTSTDVFMENNHIVNRQLESISVSIPFLFKPIVTDAMKVLYLTQA